jgi:heme exporter protein A
MPSLPPSPVSATPAVAGDMLSVDALACQRGERLLFQGLSLAVAPGEVWWLRGANGRGKTSLLRLMTGLATPAQGRVSWQGRPVRAPDAAYRERLLYLGHANGLKEDLTAAESLQFLARIHGRPADEASLTAALARLGIASRRAAPVRTLSQGQRRRVALARLALDLAQPDRDASLWVLDEPYDALDADGITTLNGLLSAQAARGGSVVLTSHLPLSLGEPVPKVLMLDEHAPARRRGAAEGLQVA